MAEKNNIFANAVAKRAEQQEKVQDTVTDKTVDRTTLTLSITVEDKKKLKMLAVENGVTIAGLIHQWIKEN